MTKYLNLFLILIILINLNDSLQSSNNVSSVLSNLSVQTALSRMINNPVLYNNPPRIQFEVYKAIVGETVRLECPQPNPTWFYRRLNNQESSSNPVEDLIVTRHGVINGDYKYKIMCHMTLKHKVIIINNIDFDEEGLYTCLYTIPNEHQPKSSSFANNDLVSNDLNTNNPIQYRYVFNVTVYTLISGLKMSLKPISMKSSSTLAPSSLNFNKKNPQDQYELVDNSLTVRENEEFLINCVVESSKPAADIKFTISSTAGINSKNEILSLNSNHISSFLTLSPSTPMPLPTSILSSNTNVAKNNDQTFKTVHSVRLRPSQDDHGKVFTCKAENGFSNQKWENKKLLNVLYAPVCKDPPKFTYYVGINQTLNIECRILNANPSRITYDWNLDNINMGISLNSFSNMNIKSIDDDDISSLHDSIVNSPNDLNNDHEQKGFSSSSPYLNNYQKQIMQSSLNNFNSNSKSINFVNEGLTSRFKWRPTSINDFGEVICKASNEIGTTECSYDIRLGGVPNPPTDCTHILKNNSAIISCQVGFHQGDPDIYCYLLRKSDNGVYKEHTRNRESCSFIVNDVNVNRLNEFWIYSSNKHGHNKDNGVYLTIGQVVKAIEPVSNVNLMIIGGSGAVIMFCVIACCFCFKIKKGLSDDSDSIYETDYQTNRNQTNSNGTLNNKKLNQNNNYPVKIIKGVKIANQESPYDINDFSKEQKYVKIDLPKRYSNDSSSLLNEDNLDKKKDYEIENYFEINKSTEINLIDDKKKFSLFKSPSSAGPTRKFDKNSLKKSQTIYKDKLSTNGNGVSSLVRTSMTNTKIKKSISFTKPLVNDSDNFSSDENKGIKESTPFFSNINHKDKNDYKKSHGLLTTVNKNTSINSLTDGNLIHQNKMVTFSNGTNTIRKNSKTNQSIATLETHTTNTTVTTSASGSSSASNASSVSTTSPTTSSTNNDSDSLNNLPLNESNDSNNKLTVSDQSFSIQTNSFMLPQRPNKLTTFPNLTDNSNRIITNHYRSPKKIVNNKIVLPSPPPSPKPSSTYLNSQDSFETKFLNKLCEEIEVSLNVDCECADDYSINDFSGDYSFDNSLKSPVMLKNKPINSSNLIELRKNYEQNVKTLRNTTTGSTSNPNNTLSLNNSVNSSLSTFQNQHQTRSTIENNQNTPNKSQLGVLV